MKFLLGGLALIAATSTWAYELVQPVQPLDPLNYSPPPAITAPPLTGGTSVRIITGYDGTQSIETGPSFSGSDEVRLIDYSGDYITEQAAPIRNGPIQFPE